MRCLKLRRGQIQTSQQDSRFGFAQPLMAKLPSRVPRVRGEHNGKSERQGCYCWHGLYAFR
jgi:hypothetical protein